MRARCGATFRLSFLCLLLGAAPALAQDVRGELEIAFTGASTLHAFEGTGPPIPVSLTQSPDGSWAAEVSVPVAQLDTGNGWRDADMRSMFEAEQHPQIVGRIHGADPARVRETGRLPFRLRIRGVERALEARVAQWQQDERSASFVAEFEVSLAAFALAAPQALFLRVDDAVRVRVRVRLERT